MKLKEIKEEDLNKQKQGTCVLDKDYDVWQLHADGIWYTPLLSPIMLKEDTVSILEFGPWYLLITGEEIEEFEGDQLEQD